MFEFRQNGRKVTMERFMEDMKRKTIEAGMKALEQRIHGAAASIVDPETGKHADVFVRRKGDEGLILRTTGSAAFAREVEKRLGIDSGSIVATKRGDTNLPVVYLAHAFEDKEALARPLANRLMENGIEPWFDEWEIRAGDSLLRKMEEGLDNCTHFLAVLTPTSLNKAWVQTEIDAGFIKAVGGKSKFIGVRCGVAVDDLSPFLRTLHSPELRIGNDDDISKLIADILGVSRKPPLGASPNMSIQVPEGLRCVVAFGHRRRQAPRLRQRVRL